MKSFKMIFITLLVLMLMGCNNVKRISKYYQINSIDLNDYATLWKRIVINHPIFENGRIILKKDNDLNMVGMNISVDKSLTNTYYFSVKDMQLTKSLETKPINFAPDSLMSLALNNFKLLNIDEVLIKNNSIFYRISDRISSRNNVEAGILIQFEAMLLDKDSYIKKLDSNVFVYETVVDF